MKIRVQRSALVLLAAWAAVSCASYKQNIMFQIPAGQPLKQQAEEAEKNYVIQPNDYLKLAVFTHHGERIVDPDLKLLKDMPIQNALTRPDPNYLVDVNGVAKFPMIGEIKIAGLTIRKAEALLQQEYTQFYSDPFVVLTYTNKRVVVLGAPVGKVVPLINENVTLVEVLALAEAIDNTAKAHNIRVIRGEEFFVADLSTLEGYKNTNMIMQHGDIVYIEPVRRPISEAARDFTPILSLGVSITTLIVVLLNLN